MEELALHILDIVQNSIRAGANHIEIIIDEDILKNKLTIQIIDDGKGMTSELKLQIKNPFVTTRTLRKVGLGIPLLSELCEECEGHLKVESELEKGTHITGTMRYNHIDRLPIGNMASTMKSLILAKPGIEYIYRHIYSGKEFVLDTCEIKNILEGVPIQDLMILEWLEQYITKGLNELREEICND